MLIGKLDRRITLKQQSNSLDEFGQKLDQWSDIVTIWANITPDKGGEKALSGEIRASDVNKFKIRYSSVIASISPTWRISYQGKEYEISQINEIGRKEGFEIIASARAE